MATITGSVAGGNWNTNGAWLAGVQPTAADDVLLTASSGSITIPTATIALCRSIDCTGYINTLTFASTTAELDIGDSGGGKATFVNTMTITLTGIGLIQFKSTQASTTFQLTSGGRVLPNITINAGTSTIIQLADDLTATSALVTLTQGGFDFNGKTCNFGSFSSSNANTRTISLGSSPITMTLASGTTWSTSTSTGLTITTNTATITCNGSNANFNAGPTDMKGLSVVLSGVGIATLTGSGAIFANITRTGTAVKGDSLSITSDIVVTGTVTYAGNSVRGVNRLLVQSSVVGTQRTLTCTGAAIVINGDVDFQDIVHSGSPSWTNTAGGGSWIGDCGGNGTLITSNATTPATQTATGTASFTWSTHGWTSRVPLPQDNVVIGNAFSASQTITEDMPRMGANINFTGTTGNPTLTRGGGISPIFYGNLIFATGMITTGSGQQFTAAGRGTQTITNAGVTWLPGLIISCPGGSYTFQDAFICSGTVAAALQVNAGTFTANNFSIATPAFISTGTITRVVNMGTNTWTLTSTGTIWNVASTGLTINPSTSTIAITDTTGASKSFGGGGMTYNNLTVSGNTADNIIVTGANTFNTVTLASGNVFTLPPSTTNTVTSILATGQNNGYIYMNATSSNYISIPDSAALSITGDIDLRYRGTMVTWIPAAVQRFIMKRTLSAGGESYGFHIDTAGKLSLVLSVNGTATVSVTSSAATGFSANSLNWIRVTWRASDGRTQFFTASGAITSPVTGDWTQLGTNQTLSVASIFDTTTQVEIGSSVSGTSGQIIGKLYRAMIINNILDDGTGIQLDADFTGKAFGADTFVESSANGATVTLNGAAIQAGDGRILINSSAAGTKATISGVSGIENLDYLTIKDSSASGGASWYAGANSINKGNNTGWNFTVPPIGVPNNALLLGVG